MLVLLAGHGEMNLVTLAERWWSTLLPPCGWWTGWCTGALSAGA
jgi:hypothetical protein